MDSTKLETFLVVCKEKSFTKAAEKLFITPAAIKKQMDALEDEVGVKLIQRSPSGCILTVGGQTFYEHAKSILKYMHSAVEQTKLVDSKQCLELCVGHSLKLDYGLISEISERFDEQRPGRFLRFERIPKSSLYTALLNHTIDCFLYINPQKNDFPDMCSQQIGSTNVHAILQRRHPLAKRERLMVSDLIGYDLYISSVLDLRLYDLLNTNYSMSLHILDKEDRNNLLFHLQHNAIFLYPCPVDHDVSIPFDHPPLEIRIYYLEETSAITELIEHLKIFFSAPQDRVLI